MASDVPWKTVSAGGRSASAVGTPAPMGDSSASARGRPALSAGRTAAPTGDAGCPGVSWGMDINSEFSIDDVGNGVQYSACALLALRAAEHRLSTNLNRCISVPLI